MPLLPHTVSCTDCPAYLSAPTAKKRKRPTRSREAHADSDEHASTEDKAREKVQDSVDRELSFADGTDMEGGVQQLATTSSSSIPLTSINLPDVSWKLVPSLKPEEDSVYFGFEFVTVDAWQAIRKAVKIDCKTGNLTFKVFKNHCMVGMDITQFKNKDHLEAILLHFHNSNVCCGIRDPKYSALGVRLIEHGLFENDTWRSTK